jgi:hypothetical protein
MSRPTLGLLLAFSVSTAVGCGSDDDDSKNGPQGSNQPGTCAGQTDRMLEFCPDRADQRDFDIEQCESTRRSFEAMDCEASYDQWLGCSARASWNCEEGPSGCDSEQNAYFSCQSAFAARTLCSSLGDNDAGCTAERPFRFGCVQQMAPKSDCVEADSGGSAAFFYCCA